MKHCYSLSLLGLALVSHALAQSTDTYINNGVSACVTNAPQIDARVFINNGAFCEISTLPFDFQNGQIFTNKGTMTGSVGYRFDHALSLGPRGPAQLFVSSNTRVPAKGAPPVRGVAGASGAAGPTIGERPPRSAAPSVGGAGAGPSGSDQR